MYARLYDFPNKFYEKIALLKIKLEQDHAPYCIECCIPKLDSMHFSKIKETK